MMSELDGDAEGRFEGVMDDEPVVDSDWLTDVVTDFDAAAVRDAVVDAVTPMLRLLDAVTVGGGDCEAVSDGDDENDVDPVLLRVAECNRGLGVVLRLVETLGGGVCEFVSDAV